MAIDTEPKRWSMLQSITPASYPLVFNPDTSGLAAIERATVLKLYGGNALDDPTPVTGRIMSSLAAGGGLAGRGGIAGAGGGLAG